MLTHACVGTLLQRQTEFAVDVLLHLHRMHARDGQATPVLLVGHSMGGMVARAAAVHARCAPGAC
jgi:alpha-beta hydrolase superfamily lysophospholipase